MNTKLLEGYIGYTTYFKSDNLQLQIRDVILLHSGKWWKPNKKFEYPRICVGNGVFQTSNHYIIAVAIVEEYFK